MPETVADEAGEFTIRAAQFALNPWAYMSFGLAQSEAVRYGATGDDDDSIDYLQIFSQAMLDGESVEAVPPPLEQALCEILLDEAGDGDPFSVILPLGFRTFADTEYEAFAAANPHFPYERVSSWHGPVFWVPEESSQVFVTIPVSRTEQPPSAEDDTVFVASPENVRRLRDLIERIERSDVEEPPSFVR